MTRVTIQEKLADAFEKFKNKVAVMINNDSFTYEEIMNRSYYIANMIYSSGINSGSHIGVLIYDRVDMISSIIGILLARCVFVPIDIEQPVSRIESMLSFADIVLLFTDEWNLNRLKGFEERIEKYQIKYIIIDKLSFTDKHLKNATSNIEYDLNDPIYLYYTSGTTELQKAVVGINKSLVHFIDWETGLLSINDEYRISQFSSPGFDAFLRDVFVPLCSGSTICIFGGNLNRFNGKMLIDWIDFYKINIIHCTPGVFKLFNTRYLEKNNFHFLKYVLLAGEKINPKDLNNWYNIFSDRIQLINLYGATETTMVKTYYYINPCDIQKESIPIGKPMPGTEILILNENFDRCNSGEVGEIYIRTSFGTYGYYNNLELNKLKFIKNPFVYDSRDTLYKTGDNGKFLEDGNVELLGRNDRQVKINGVCIDINELENVLLKHCWIDECAVVVIENEDNSFENLAIKYTYKKFFVAYYVSSQNLSSTDIKLFLDERLSPCYIPTYFVQIERMPITCNGKIDYQDLYNRFSFSNT